MAHTLFMRLISLTIALAACASYAHDGHNSPVPWQACDNKHPGDPCEYSNTSQDLYRGSCREVEHKLLCVRNQPIVKGCVDRLHCAPPLAAATASSPVDHPVPADKSAF